MLQNSPISRRVWNLKLKAGPKGLEPSTSGLTGQRSNQLNYDPKNLYFLKASLRIYESILLHSSVCRAFPARLRCSGG